MTRRTPSYRFRPIRGLWWLGCVLGAYLAGGWGAAVFALLAGLDVTMEPKR